MRNFPQYLLVFLLGAGVGAVAVLVSQPGFSLVVTTMAPPKAVPAPAVVATPAPATVAKVAEPAKPAAPVAVAPVAAPAPAAVAPVASAVPAAPTSAAPGLDFAALTERPVFWPASVTLTTATSVPLLDNGKRIGELPLAAGSVLQLSKVLATGAIEARAQGQKFEIDSKLTDFEAIVRKKVQEVIEKGDKTLAPILRTALASVPTVTPATLTAPAMPAPAAPAVAAEPAKVAVVAPARLTFDDKVNVLFGRKAAAPEKAEAAPAVATPVAPAVPAPVTPPAPAVDAKVQDKKADLDRRMNGLFGTPAK